MNNNIQEFYCSFEVSKLLKEKGFSWNNYSALNNHDKEGITLESGYYCCYNEDGKVIRPKFYSSTNPHYPRPTHALAIEWIRVNFGFFCFPDAVYDFSSWTPRVVKKRNHSILYSGSLEFDTQQQATEAALLYTLQNLIP